MVQLLLLSVFVLTSLICLTPKAADAALPPIHWRDPYRENAWLLKLEFEDETRTHETDGGKPTESNTFLQRYTLKVKGSLWDPRFIVYRGGVRYQATTGRSADTEGKGDSWAYHVSTVILRKFRFPLTLYANKSTSTNTVNSKNVKPFTSTYESTTYGLNWNLKFRVLPVTIFKAERTITTLNKKKREYIYDLLPGDEETDP